MDKDSIILKYEQNEVANAASNLETAASQNNDQSKELDELQEKMKRIYELTGKQPFPPSSVQLAKPSESTVERSTSMPPQTLTYDQLFSKASNSLVTRGLDVDSLDYHSLCSGIVNL